MLLRMLAVFLVCVFPVPFQGRLRRRIRYALEVANDLREKLRTRDAVFQAFGRRARAFPANASSSNEKLVLDFQGLAIIVVFNGDYVEHAYITNSDDVLDNETHRQFPWIQSDECFQFAVSKGLVKGDDR